MRKPAAKQVALVLLLAACLALCPPMTMRAFAGAAGASGGGATPAAGVASADADGNPNSDADAAADTDGLAQNDAAPPENLDTAAQQAPAKSAFDPAALTPDAAGVGYLLLRLPPLSWILALCRHGASLIVTFRGLLGRLPTPLAFALRLLLGFAAGLLIFACIFRTRRRIRRRQRLARKKKAAARPKA